MSDSNQQYDASSIQSLSGCEHVRKRPGMYFGGTDQYALHIIFEELVKNAIIQVIKGQATQVIISLHDESQVIVQDNGAGIPVEPYEDTTMLTYICTTVGFGYKHRPYGSFPDSGVGIAAVNAISENFNVEVKRDGYLWTQNFTHGKPLGELQQVRPLEASEGTGTSISFKPDFSILQRADFDYFKLLNRLHEYVYMMPELTIILQDKRTNPQGTLSTIIQHPRGLAEYVEFLNRDYEVFHQPIHIREKAMVSEDYKSPEFEVEVDIAFQYATASQYLVIGYVNTEEMGFESVHIQEFLNKLKRSLENIANQQNISKGKFYQVFAVEDILQGLTAVINIWHPLSNFESNMCYKLDNKSAVQAVSQILQDTLAKYENELQSAVKHCLNNRKLREERRFGRGGK